MSRLASDEFLRAQVKVALRKRMRGVRKAMPAEACERRSAAIVARLLELQVFEGAIEKRGTVGLFWPILSRHEVDLRSLDMALRARGVAVAYPAIDSATNVMTFRITSHSLQLSDQGYGFLEPLASAPQATKLDIIIVPALAVDPAGHRIGYGAGYYDRALAALAPPAATVAVAYDWQLIAEVPATDGDVAVQWVVTDTRVLKAV
ncbi:MAG: 5-formyltetrahydrofolate cyclo-ligase [Polyangiaceae bacterium]|nr:5-formyltetrahydrofolate cyclo-ligase [Polyangiaceae bacterium]